jgi:hypothetical protein
MATETVTPVQVLDITDQTLAEFGPEYAEKALVLQKELALEKITDDPTYQRVARAGLDAAANIKAIEAYLNPLCERRYAAWKRATTVRSDKTAPFEVIKKKAGQLVAKYQYEQEQAKLAAEAAERARLMEEEALLRSQQAEQLAKEGRVEEGLAVLESPTITSAPVVASGGAPVVKGVSKAAERYKATVTNLMELVKAVAAGTVPILALEANEKFLRQQANSMKQLMNYPGVKVERDFNSSFRG